MLPLDDLHFEFSSQVYERQDPLDDKILDDFEGQQLRNTHAYAVLLLAMRSLPIGAGYSPPK